MKYKVGDKVRVKSKEWYETIMDDINYAYPDEKWEFTSLMAAYCGDILTVESIPDGAYRLYGGAGYGWSDYMLEDVPNEGEVVVTPDIASALRPQWPTEADTQAVKDAADKLLAITSSPSDPVNHPDHYASGGIECIEAIKASMTEEAFHGYLKGNVQKYLWRYEKKAKPVEDLCKANWYLSRLIEELECK